MYEASLTCTYVSMYVCMYVCDVMSTYLQCTIRIHPSTLLLKPRKKRRMVMDMVMMRRRRNDDVGGRGLLLCGGLLGKIGACNDATRHINT